MLIEIVEISNNFGHLKHNYSNKKTPQHHQQLMDFTINSHNSERNVLVAVDEQNKFIVTRTDLFNTPP